MNSEKENFLKAWNHFESVLKARLTEKSKQSELTVSYANIILKDVVSRWFKNYGEEGIWLTRYAEENSEKADEIIRVLKEKLIFSPIESAKTLSPYLKYALPTVGAVAGICVAKAFSAGAILSCAAAVVPAAILYPTAKEYETTVVENKRKEIVDLYVLQLNPYKEKIAEIINT